ncbi:MAG: hypothetical protein LQ351_005008 [Letrouitia transgressa]|nr:MAG: hypothetical protein LQ351_005008 [Letrouitia transgressa]
MDSQFQLGFDLSTFLSPITNAVSTIGSLALVDAIRKGGSDVITETKLAKLLGPNRIDPAVETHFRHAVAKSEQTFISRYLEIVLESGAGPTVQNALKNTALFSMIVQMSLLSYVHDHQSFSNTLVKAIERIIKDFKVSSDVLPDYVSLVGTIQVCRRETAAFMWESLFESVERRIQRCLLKVGEPVKRSSKRRKMRHKALVDPDRASVNDRRLQFVVLESLLLSLSPLQHWPLESRLLIECATGIVTLVVWCHHVLGLSVRLSIEGCEIEFGSAPYNVFIKELELPGANASLLNATSPNEPLFHFSSSECDPKTYFDLRTKLYGFGKVALRESGVPPYDMEGIYNCIIKLAVASTNQGCQCGEKGAGHHSKALPIHEPRCGRSFSRYPDADRVLKAGCVLFGLDHLYGQNLRPLARNDQGNLGELIRFLTQLLLSLARIRALELEKCTDLLLVYQDYSLEGNGTDTELNLHDGIQMPSLTESFMILSRHILGHKYSDAYVEEAVLISEGGWSLFFDSLDATDPTDVSLCNLRLLRGVPSREGVRKERVLDGPTELQFSNSQSATFEVGKGGDKSTIHFFPGISTSDRGFALIGYDENDAFLATQSFSWKYMHKEIKTHLMGFREMVELCEEPGVLDPLNLLSQKNQQGCLALVARTLIDRNMCFPVNRRPEIA